MTVRHKSYIPPNRLRNSAEEALAESPHKVAPMPPVDVHKLVHELQVHQIELEMQNEELRKVQLDLEAARERMLLPYDASPVGFLTLDAKGVICEANLAAARLLKFDRVKLAGQNLTLFIAPESQAVFTLHCRRLFSTEEKQTCELRLLRTGCLPIEARLEIVVECATRQPATRCLVVMSDITDQKRAEEVIRDQEIQLRLITDTTPVMLTRCSRDLRYRFVNRACAALLGFAPEEIVGKPIAEIMGAEAFETVRPHVEQVLQGQRIEFEGVVPYARGGARFVRVIYTPDRDEHGGVQGWVGSITDVTEYKRAEAALRESEARFGHLADAAPVLIWMSGTDKLCTYFNQPWLAFTGRTLEQELGDGWSAGVHPDDLQGCVRIYLESFEARQEFRMEYRLRRQDGEYRWILDHGIPRFADQQLFLGYLGCCVDITDRKRTEDALRESERRERERAQELAVLIEAIPTPVMIVHDPDARHITGNRAAHELVRVPHGGEFSVSAAVGSKPSHFRSFKDGRELPLAELPAQRAARGAAVNDFEFNLVFDDGTVRVLLGYGTPLLDTQGLPRGAVHTLVDITGLRQAEQALQEAHDHLETRVRERTKQLNWANEALRGEKAFSDSLIELAPAIIAVVDARGKLVRTNAYAQQLMGYPFAETQGRNMIEMFVPKAEQPRLRQLLQEALQGRLTQAIIAPLLTRDGSVRYVEWFSKPLSDADGKLSAVLAIGHDITERKQAEEALRRSERHLSNFFNQAPIGLVWLSASGNVLRANQTQLDLLGCRADDFLSRPFQEFIAEPTHGYELLKCLAAQETVHNLRLPLRRRDGVIRHVLLDANSSRNGNRFEYSSVFLRDITDRLQLEQEVLHISEREHRRIAQDLHDGLGQLLVGAAYLAGTVQQDLAAKARPEAPQLHRIWEVINEALTMTRNLAHGLHPVAAEQNGLMVALEALAARTRKLFQIRCCFNCPRPVLVQNDAVATHLFRIAQEAVTNAIKHGKSERIQIRLTPTREGINLTVTDDGLGMPARQRKPAGMGLRIMRYRAGIIGASLAIQKAARGGTSIVCSVNLADSGARKSTRGPRKHQT